MRRKIAVVTGSRAEYGLLVTLMRTIKEDAELELQVIVTGMHLSPEFGLTYKLIEEDGFTISGKVESLLSSDSSSGIAKSIGLGVIGFADIFEKLKPDILVVLGDRFEIFAAAQAAMIFKIPIAHICGGEVTQGAMDDSFRHAITKFSSLHFVAADAYRNRVIQLGEHPQRVYNWGSPGLEYLTQMTFLNREELEKTLDFQFGDINFLITYHSVTLDNDPHAAVIALLQALDHFPQAKLIFTGTNADANGRIINRLLEGYVNENKKCRIFFPNLGTLKYASVVRQVDAVIGNSSSAVIEVPFLGTTSINIGDRQKGRLLASSIINCREDKDEIKFAIEKAISSEFKSSLQTIISPYKYAQFSLRVKNELKNIVLDGIVKKQFFDIECAEGIV